MKNPPKKTLPTHPERVIQKRERRPFAKCRKRQKLKTEERWGPPYETEKPKKGKKRSPNVAKVSCNSTRNSHAKLPFLGLSRHWGYPNNSLSRLSIFSFSIFSNPLYSFSKISTPKVVKF